LPDFEKFMALNETIVYLKELKAEGAIKEDHDDNVLVYTAQKSGVDSSRIIY